MISMSTHSILCKSIVGISVVLLAIFSDSQENVRAESIDLSQHVPKRIGTDFRLGGPLSPFINENFIGSGRCANCHSILVDKNGKDMSIANHWRSTMMANAAKDPLWQAKVASEVSRNPALKEVIEKKCVSCHMPMAYRQENELPDKYKTDSKVGVFHAYLDRNSKLHEAAQDGVSCSLCHQIQDKGLGTEETFSGKFTIDMKTPAPDRKIFGPYRDPIRDTMKVSVGFDPAYGPQMNDSALCAACHMLYTPYVDSKGNVVGTFPEQTVYLEWLNSIYGEAIGKRHEISETVGNVRLCQECHMPHSEDGGVVIAYYAPKEVQPKDHFSQHHFVGGNVFMLNILMDNLAVLDIRASQAKLADTRARTIAQLQKDTARISIAAVEQDKKRLTAEVQVENLVGHKFPSGIPIRRTWIHFTVKDSDGTIIFESGKPLADGSIAGNAADESSSGFEPHYAEITSPDQVQIYEAMMHDTDNNVTYTLLRGAGYIKDNRLLPKGFELKKASSDIAVYGKAASDDNFTGGGDRITYSVDIAGKKGPFTVAAELYFAPVSYAFVRDLQKDLNLPLVANFSRYFTRADKMPVMVAATSKMF